MRAGKLRARRGGDPAREHARTPETVLGDLRGQVGVGRLGERRLAETVQERYGVDALLAVFAQKKRITEARVRALLERWPDASAEAEIRVDSARIDDDAAVRYHVRVEKQGETLTFDFSGSSHQVAMPINVRPSIVRGCCYYAVIGMLDPSLENNAGMERARHGPRPQGLDRRRDLPGADERLHADRDGAGRNW